MVEKIKIILISDHVLLRAGLLTLLSGIASFEVEADGSYHQAILLIKDFCPDIIILDLVCDDKDEKTDIIAEMVNLCPTSHILIIANSIEDINLVKAFKREAIGCLLRDSNQAEIIEAVHTLMAGGNYLPARNNIEETSKEKTITHPDLANIPKLSKRQKIVLQLVSQGFTNQEIAEQLVISRRTAEMHIYRIFKKLLVSNRTQAVQAALHYGILNIEGIETADKQGHHPPKSPSL